MYSKIVYINNWSKYKFPNQKIIFVFKNDNNNHEIKSGCHLIKNVG